MCLYERKHATSRSLHLGVFALFYINFWCKEYLLTVFYGRLRALQNIKNEVSFLFFLVLFVVVKPFNN